MTSDTLQIDPAVDVVVPRKGAITCLTPEGPFTIKDPHGLVLKVFAQFRMPRSRLSFIEGISDQPERMAADELIELLCARRVFTSDEIPTDDEEPLGSWIRHYAGARDVGAIAVHLTGRGHLADALKRRLQGARIAVTDDPASAALRVIALDVPDVPALLAANSAALADNARLLPVWLNRSVINIGPTVIPRATACLACLLHRQQAVKWRSEPAGPANGVSVSPSTAEVAASLVLAEALRSILDAHVNTDFGMAHQFDLVGLRITSGRVLRLPRCASCEAATLSCSHV